MSKIDTIEEIDKTHFQYIEIQGGNEIQKIKMREIIYKNAIQKYKNMTEKIINQIQMSKRKGNVKHQTLGWKQAKEIKKWCEQNNIICNIVEDVNITQNKLHSIDMYVDNDGINNDNYINFIKIKQNVVYVLVNK